MTQDELYRLEEMFADRSEDFKSADKFYGVKFNLYSWMRYLKKIGVQEVHGEDIREVYNDKKENTLLLDVPNISRSIERMRSWYVMSKDTALKFLVLGQLPPRSSKKPRSEGK